jgi:aminopeptidase
MAYKDSYRGDGSVFTQQDWIDLGFNDSVVHTDIVSTSPRTVTATLTDGTQKIIYDQGMFADRLYQ